MHICYAAIPAMVPAPGCLAVAQQATPGRVVGGHQIDRYEAKERGAEAFRQSRSRATQDDRDARRRELARSGNAPALRAYPAPAAATPGRFDRRHVGAPGIPYSYQDRHDSAFGPVHPRTTGREAAATGRAAPVKPAARAAPP